MNVDKPPILSSEPEGRGASDWVRDLIADRQTVTPKRLLAPGPTPPQLEALLKAAAAAPDHGRIRPWRFVLVPTLARAKLGRAFRDALLERDPTATQEQQADALEKAQRAPCLLLAVVDLSARDQPIPAFERVVSLGCAIQNMLLLARAMGFDSGLSSGQALDSSALRCAFSLGQEERAVCFVTFGTATTRRAIGARPNASQLCSELAA